MIQAGPAIAPTEAAATYPRRVSMNPANVPPPIRGYYSNCVRVASGPLLFLSGQLGMDMSGTIVGAGDPAAQADQALRNLQTMLAANGATMRDVVKVTVYVTDITYLDVIEPVRMKYFPADGPASAIVEVARLALPEAKVEIEAVAAI